MSEFLTFEDFLNEKKSPYKPETLEKYKKKWEKGEEIPFGIEASLKAQGLIPRADGKKRVSPEYQKDNVLKKAISSKTEEPVTHAEKVEQRIHKEEEERKKPKKDKILKNRLEFSKKKKHGSPDDKHLEGNKGKVEKPYDPKIDKPHKKGFAKKITKTYNPKAMESTVPTFDELFDQIPTIPTFDEFKKEIGDENL